jgi:hypothetical protein
MLTLFLNAVQEAISASGTDLDRSSLDNDMGQIMKYMPMPSSRNSDAMNVDTNKMLAARELVRDSVSNSDTAVFTAVFQPKITTAVLV